MNLHYSRQFTRGFCQGLFTGECQAISDCDKLSLHNNNNNNNNTTCILFRFINNVLATDYILVTGELQLWEYWLMNVNAVDNVNTSEENKFCDPE
jgi:hypothetical protein